jgi:hypothetical protein
MQFLAGLCRIKWQVHFIIVTIQNGAKIFDPSDYRIFAWNTKSLDQAVTRNHNIPSVRTSLPCPVPPVPYRVHSLQTLDCVLTVKSLLQFTLTHPACRCSVVRQMLASHKVLNLQLIKGFPCSGILRGADWQLVIELWGQPVGLILKGQANIPKERIHKVRARRKPEISSPSYWFPLNRDE